MSNGMLTAIAILMMIALFAVLIWGKVSPVIAMSIIPIIACIICRFPISDVIEWVTACL